MMEIIKIFFCPWQAVLEGAGVARGTRDVLRTLLCCVTGEGGKRRYVPRSHVLPAARSSVSKVIK
jgi:hypothetical protein